MRYFTLFAFIVILSGCATDQEKYEADKNHCVMYYNIDDTPENKTAIDRCVYKVRYDRGDIKSTSEKLSEFGNNMRNEGIKNENASLGMSSTKYQANKPEPVRIRIVPN